jgi:hypothetical protein
LCKQNIPVKYFTSRLNGCKLSLNVIFRGDFTGGEDSGLVVFEGDAPQTAGVSLEDRHTLSGVHVPQLSCLVP